MRSGVAVDEVLELRGLRGSVLLEQVTSVARDNYGYSAVPMGFGATEFTRTFRPTWAIVTSILLFPLAPFLLIFSRTSERFRLQIENDHRGERVRVSGKVIPDMLESIQQAAERTGGQPLVIGVPGATGGSVPIGDIAKPPIAPGAPAETSAVSDDAPVGLPDLLPLEKSESPSTSTGVEDDAASAATLVDSTVAPRQSVVDPNEHTVSLQSTRLITRAASWSLRGEDITIGLIEGMVIVGRAPSAFSSDGDDVLLVSVDDDSVSKSHAAVGITDGACWVVDRHSTNGTVITRGENSFLATPGEAVLLYAGDRVAFGELELCLESE